MKLFLLFLLPTLSLAALWEVAPFTVAQDNTCITVRYGGYGSSYSFNTSLLTTFNSYACEVGVSNVTLGGPCTNVPAFMPGSTWPGAVAVSVGYGTNGFSGFSEPNCKGNQFCCSIMDSCFQLNQPKESRVASIEFDGSIAFIRPTPDCSDPIHAQKKVTQIKGNDYLVYSDEPTHGQKMTRLN